jgi:hypothetical protein
MVVLLLMISTYAAARWDRGAKTMDSEDTENLLGSGHTGPNDYGAINCNDKPVPQHASKPKAGWLEYFIGFRVLFPYIW